MFMRLQAMTAKEEVTYGTDSAPTAAVNAILAQSVKLEPMIADKVERKFERPRFAANPFLLVGKYARITFEVEAKGSGAAGTPPATGVFLKSCRCAETISAGVSVTYNPTSSNFKSCSIYFYLDGILFKMIGCRGTWSYMLNAKGIPVLEFVMTGLFTQPTDGAVPAAPTYGTQLTQIPQTASSANTPTFSVGAYAAPAASAFSFKANNEVTARFILRREEILITGSDETVEFTLDAALLATWNPYALAEAHTTQAISLVHGVGAGKIVTLSIPAFQLENPSGYEADNGILVQKYQGKAVEPDSTGNNQFTLTFS